MCLCYIVIELNVFNNRCPVGWISNISISVTNAINAGRNTPGLHFTQPLRQFRICVSHVTVYQNTGDPERSRSSQRSTLEWINEVQLRGAGEIVLNCMNQDGVKNGYDVEQLSKAREICGVPLIASGGAGTMAHFKEVFTTSNVDGALAATVFHSAQIKIPDLKPYLIKANIAIRPPEIKD